VTPGERFAAPPDLDAADIRDAYELGLRHAAAVRSRTCVDDFGRLEAMGRDEHRAYRLSVSRGPIQAPPPWPVEVALLAVEAAVIIWGSDVHGIRQGLVKGPPLTALILLTHGARTRAERRRARQLELTVRTAPQPIMPVTLLILPLAVLPCQLYHRRRRGGLKREASTLVIARTVVSHAMRRWSWHRALPANATSTAHESKRMPPMPL
jgi:hypothetical protein